MIPTLLVYRSVTGDGRYHLPSVVTGMDDVSACSAREFLEAEETDEGLVLELDEDTGKVLARVPLRSICPRCFIVDVRQNVSLPDDVGRHSPMTRSPAERVTPQ